MYAISLTSIPPRFQNLGPVLHSLLAQDPAPAQVFLCLPRRSRRFSGPCSLPALPAQVTVMHCNIDLGPATKALPAARHLAGQIDRLIYCDDDWLMPPGWAAALLAARASGTAVTGAGFGVQRLGRQSPRPPGTGLTDIAQGFSGVLIDPAWLAGPGLDPPDTAWPVDDIWLSGHLARQGIPVREAIAARTGMIPAFDDSHGLQDAEINGQARDQANRACAALIHDRYGIWPNHP